MVKNNKFITINVGNRKYKLITTDLRKVYKINTNTRPNIPLYHSNNPINLSIKSNLHSTLSPNLSCIDIQWYRTIDKITFPFMEIHKWFILYTIFIFFSSFYYTLSFFYFILDLLIFIFYKSFLLYFWSIITIWALSTIKLWSYQFTVIHCQCILTDLDTFINYNFN